jgi:CxxC motif-containing protein (DUF1111 family)
MKTIQTIALSGMLGLALACSTSTQTVSSSAPPPIAATAPVVATVEAPAEKPDNGVHEATQKEYEAAQVKYNDVTTEQLKEGYKIYAQGACINCHEAKNIYKRSEEKWVHILDDMAEKAALSAVEKAAVTRYVFAIKAGQK